MDDFDAAKTFFHGNVPFHDGQRAPPLGANFNFEETPAITPAPLSEPVDYESQDASAGESAGCFRNRHGFER
jgi:hypothetical protein